MTWIVIALLLFFGYMVSRRRHVFPSSIQVAGEMLVGQFYALTESALGKERAQSYAPLIVALFMFLLLSNWIGAIPHLSEPTTDLNTPLSLGLMGLFWRITQASGPRASRDM
jgi:F-type H+-transporting ATPase subunit a